MPTLYIFYNAYWRRKSSKIAIDLDLFSLLQFIPYYQYLPLESNRKIEAGLRIVQNAIDSKIALKRKSKIKPTSG